MVIFETLTKSSVSAAKLTMPSLRRGTLKSGAIILPVFPWNVITPSEIPFNIFMGVQNPPVTKQSVLGLLAVMDIDLM